MPNFPGQGQKPSLGGVTTPASINSAYTLANVPGEGAVLNCTVVIEGTASSRYTWNGTTPTTSVGLLLRAPAADAPVTFVLHGQALIEAFRIIGTASGNTITYQYSMMDTR